MKEGGKMIICCRISAFSVSVVHKLCFCFQSEIDKSTCLLGEPNMHFKFIPMRLQACWLSVLLSRLCNFCSLLYCVADIARAVWGKKKREKKLQESRERKVLWVSLPLFSALLRLSDLWPMSGQKKCSYSPGSFLSMGVKGQTTCRQWDRLPADAAAHSALFSQVITPLDNWVLWPKAYILWF